MLKNALSAKAVASLKSGKHRDGEGLQFEVKGGSRRWTFNYMFEGRQRELAIGKYPAMSLAEARAKRAELREAKDRGLDPRAVLAGAAVPAKAITLRQDTATFVAHMRGQWKPAHLKEWQQSMERIAGPLMDKPTSRLTQADVLAVIKPVWETTNETARRVLGRIEQTIDHAMAVDPGRFIGPRPCDNVLRRPPPRVGCGQAQAGDAVAGSTQLLCQVAATPGDRGARARTAVAHLLPPNQRGSLGDMERDRRRSLECPGGAHEIRCRTDNSVEHRRSDTARQHQAGSDLTRHAHLR